MVTIRINVFENTHIVQAVSLGVSLFCRWFLVLILDSEFSFYDRSWFHHTMEEMFLLYKVNWNILKSISLYLFECLMINNWCKYFRSKTTDYKSHVFQCKLFCTISSDNVDKTQKEKKPENLRVLFDAYKHGLSVVGLVSKILILALNLLYERLKSAQKSNKFHYLPIICDSKSVFISGPRQIKAILTRNSGHAKHLDEKFSVLSLF